MITPAQALLIGGVIAAIAALPTLFLARCSLGLKQRDAYMATVVSLLASVAAFFFATGYFLSHPNLAAKFSLIVWSGSASAAVLAGLPLLLKLYRAWLRGEMRDCDRAPGPPGFRAWLSLPHLCLAVVFSAAAANLFDCTFVGTLGLILLALGAYPLIRTLNSADTSTHGNHEIMNTSREKILAMVESNKITAEEGVELLNALGANDDPSRPSAPRPQFRSAVVVGAILIVVGFFLPWFTVDLNKEAQRASSALNDAFASHGFPFGNAAQSFIGNLGQNFPQVKMNVAGGDVPHGIGWAILLLGIAVAALPLFVSQIHAETQKRIELVAISVGVFLLLYLCCDSWRYISIGFILVAAGYLIQAASAIARLGGLRAIGGLAQNHA